MPQCPAVLLTRDDQLWYCQKDAGHGQAHKTVERPSTLRMVRWFATEEQMRSDLAQRGEK